MRDYFDINRGHMVAVDEHDCRFGRTWQPVCIEDNCWYRGPFVPRKRARDIADEHVLKSMGTWRPAK